LPYGKVVSLKMRNDLYYRLRHDTDFRNRLHILSERIRKSSDKADKDALASTQRNKDLIELYKLSNFNPGLLVPYFFPAYPKTQPLSLRSRPFVFSMLDFIVGGYLVIRASRQIGKCFDCNTLHEVIVDEGPVKIMTAEQLFALCLSMQTEEPELKPGEIPASDWHIDKSVYVERDRIKVRTPTGFSSLKRAFKTHNMAPWLLVTSKHTLKAAGKHIVVRADGAQVWVQDVEVGDMVQTVDGPLFVTHVEQPTQETTWVPMFDFEVDTLEHLHYTSGILSHNSTGLIARQLINSHILPNFRSLYIAPFTEHVKTYASRFREMERAFRFPETSPNCRQNLNLKEYSNGSKVELLRILSSAKDARGKSTDELLYDEYQLFDPELELEVEQTQSQSELPITIYSGTSVTVDTPLESRYVQSSGGVWMMRARDGKHWINCGDPDDVLRVFKPEGPTCPYTGRLLDVTDGDFVHADQNMYKAGRRGLHIPQIIVPDNVQNQVKWAKIYRSFVSADRKKFLQEIMGIPTEEGARELTLEQLKRMCCLEESKEALRKKARQGFYRYVISGCDWGGSDFLPDQKSKVSYTVHAILGLRHDNKFDILHMARYSGMSYREIAGAIANDHEHFGGGPIGTDFGVGAAYNMLLRESPKINADRHIIFYYTGPTSAPISLVDKEHQIYNMYSLNRTESITSLYEAIKHSDGPRIRCYSWAEASSYLEDFMNLYRVPTETAAGNTGFRYRRHGAKADDTLHAVNFAFVIGRLLCNEPLVEDKGLQDSLNALLSGQAHVGLGALFTGPAISG
jgi:hypothetical protein